MTDLPFTHYEMAQNLLATLRDGGNGVGEKELTVKLAEIEALLALVDAVDSRRQHSDYSVWREE